MRTFIAIDLPDAIKDEIRDRQRRIQSALHPNHAHRLLRWTLPDKMHITLRFLGETSDEQRDRLAQPLRRIAAAQSPFQLQLSQIGVFPNWSRLRVLWIGLDGELESLQQMQQAVEAAAQEAGFAAEGKSFSPHITLARIGKDSSNEDVRRLGGSLQTWSQQTAAPSGSPWTVDRIIHVQSQLRAQGALYTPLAEFPLS